MRLVLNSNKHDDSQNLLISSWALKEQNHHGNFTVIIVIILQIDLIIHID